MAARRPLPRRKRKQPSVDLTQELVQLINRERYADVIARCEKQREHAALSATCLHILGTAQIRLGQFDASIEALKCAAEKCAVDSDDGQSLAILNELSKAYFSARRYADAADLLASLVDQHPQQVELHRNLILVLEKANRLDDATKRCESASRRWPDDEQLAFQLGDLNMATETWTSAAEAFSRCLELNANNDAARRRLVSAYRALGDQGRVAETLREWLRQDPENAVVAHLLAAQEPQSGPASACPSRASDAYVREVFDQFAESFDEQLAALQYASPQRLAEIIAELGIEKNKRHSILDAGCGTGLMSEHLLPYASRLVGVDLSAGMLQQAEDRGYDELVCEELVSYLTAQHECFDLVVSADTLNYFGDLEPVFGAVRRCMSGGDLSGRSESGRSESGGSESASGASGGHAYLLFTLEKHDDANNPGGGQRGYHLNRSGRYSHDVQYVRRALEDAGFCDIQVRESPIRKEAGTDVLGQYWIAKTPCVV